MVHNSMTTRILQKNSRTEKKKEGGRNWWLTSLESVLWILTCTKFRPVFYSINCRRENVPLKRPLSTMDVSSSIKWSCSGIHFVNGGWKLGPLKTSLAALLLRGNFLLQIKLYYLKSLIFLNILKKILIDITTYMF